MAISSYAPLGSGVQKIEIKEKRSGLSIRGGTRYFYPLKIVLGTS